MKNTFTISLVTLALFCLFSACQSKEKEAIEKQLNTFFTKTVMHNEVDQTALSTELGGLLKQAIEAEKNDALATKNGPFPTDKPLLIEGDIFSSLYEGRTGASIQTITIDKEKAKAILALENKPYNTQWTDTVMLVKEQDVWKIDDVVFGHPNNKSTTRNVLNSFLSAYRNKLNTAPKL